jgi:YD repeat-containing protein
MGSKQSRLPSQRPIVDHRVCGTMSATDESGACMRSRPLVNRRDLTRYRTPDTSGSPGEGRRSIRKSAMTPPVKNNAAHTYPPGDVKRVSDSCTLHSMRAAALCPFSSYPYRGMAYADPDAVTQIANGLSTTSLVYDADGNLAQKTVDGTTTTYTYDYLNRLTALGTTANGTTTYGYDAFGQRGDCPAEC